MRVEIGYRLAAILGMALAPAAARADIIFDDFGTPNPAFEFTFDAPVQPLLGFSPFTPTFNGNATRFITINTSASAGAPALNLSYGGGTLNITTSASTASGTALIYMPIGFPGPMTMNFTALGATGITLDFLSVPAGMKYAIYLSDTHLESASFNGTVAGQSSVTAPFSAFSGVDLSSVTRFDVYLNAHIGGQIPTFSPDVDFVLDSVILETPDPVPAPPAAFLALLAVPVLRLRKWTAKP